MADEKWEIVEKMWDSFKNWEWNYGSMPNFRHNAWWKCPKGHSFRAYTNEVYLDSYHACPYCNEGSRDGKSILWKMWDFKKNRRTEPIDLGATGEKVAWWRCEKGHSFKESASTILRCEQLACPKCAKEKERKMKSATGIWPDDL